MRASRSGQSLAVHRLELRRRGLLGLALDEHVEERAVEGAPVEALVDLANEVGADLLVVGNVGLNTIAGRLLGSVPANVARKSKTDVLIVHTTN